MTIRYGYLILLCITVWFSDSFSLGKAPYVPNVPTISSKRGPRAEKSFLDSLITSYTRTGIGGLGVFAASLLKATYRAQAAFTFGVCTLVPPVVTLSFVTYRFVHTDKNFMHDVFKKYKKQLPE